MNPLLAVLLVLALLLTGCTQEVIHITNDAPVFSSGCCVPINATGGTCSDFFPKDQETGGWDMRNPYPPHQPC